MFRFTIQDMLWLTVVVGLGVSWWADHHSLTEAFNRLVAHIRWQQAGPGAMGVNEFNARQATLPDP
jgi:hypothetical protein